VVEVTFSITISEIAGVKPSASECLRGRFGIAVIAAHDTWPANEDLPSLARLDVMVGRVGDSASRTEPVVLWIRDASWKTSGDR